MRRSIRYLLICLALLLVAGGGFLAFYIPTLKPRLKQRVLTALEQRFDADVQLADLQVSIFPVPSVDGEGLVISQKNRVSSDQPMIRISHFHAQAGITTIFSLRNLVGEVVLDGLQIHLPPRSAGRYKLADGQGTAPLKFFIQKIVARQALLEIEPKPGKDPLVFPIESLTMLSVGPGQAMAFSARLTNAKPPGAIDTNGHFGPWKSDDPRATPISGNYTFDHANLSVFKGIRGILSSQGSYSGVLQQIVLDGTTDTPDFALQKGGAAVHLTTTFHSIVDGTNGDTLLQPVDAKFGHSEFFCKGGVVHHTGDPGKTVELQAEAKQARMEDILALVVKGEPMMRGGVDFQSRIVIPPGQQPVVDKLNLDGQFHLNSGTFTNPRTALRLRTLSERASGISKAEEQRGDGETGRVASNLAARFRLKNGVISLAGLSFEVPGSRIHLAGNYSLVSSALDMKGTFAMQAKLSQTQSGLKSVLLKPLDRFFEKDGAGFEVPISISGTREHPTIGVEAFHKTFSIH